MIFFRQFPEQPMTVARVIVGIVDNPDVYVEQP